MAFLYRGKFMKWLYKFGLSNAEINTATAVLSYGAIQIIRDTLRGFETVSPNDTGGGGSELESLNDTQGS